MMSKYPTIRLNVVDASSSGEYIVLKLCTMDPERPTRILIVIEQRYSRCLLLHAKMRAFLAEIELPPLALSGFLGGFDANYLEDSRVSLEVFLNSVTSHRLLCNDPDFLSLIGLEQDMCREQREEETPKREEYKKWAVICFMTVPGIKPEANDANVIAARM
ncbi:hypothetical protein TcYC6_0071670 [Trypanosoma cruzi]|nr:hypothetical protein TcYC6_0071670 [Trypanosoma cruzi]